MPLPEPRRVCGVPAVAAAGATGAVPGGVLTDRDAPAFDVHLENFSGPFDLLLGLISRRRLEITEVALAAVTDEFIAHLRRMLAASEEGPGDTTRSSTSTSAALGQASGFLVVAATLLDLKTARLLPATDDDGPDQEALALLEARDLLFARLLQHRAYAQVASHLRQRLIEGARGVPRPGGTGAADPLVARLLPELVLTTTPGELAALAAAALAAPLAGAGGGVRVDLGHLHAPAVSVAEQVALLRERLVARHLESPGTSVAFSDLVADAGADGMTSSGSRGVAVVVGRFLAVLELYRRGEADLEQATPGAPLRVRWCGDPS